MPSFRGSSQTRDWTHVSLLHLQADSLLLVLPGKPSTHGGRCLLKTHHCTYFMSFNPWQLTKDKTESQKGSENFPKSHRQRFYSVWNTPKPEENGKINNTACVFLWNFYILFIFWFFRVLPPVLLVWCSVWWPWGGGAALPAGPVVLLFAFSSSSGWCDLGIRTLRDAEQSRGHCSLKDTEISSANTDRCLSRWVRSYRQMGTVVKAAGRVDVHPWLQAGNCMRWPHNQSVSMFTSLRYFYL